MSGAARQGLAGGPAKEDPETLVLRGSPRPAVRFRRGLIVAIAAIVASFAIGIAWLGLQPPHIAVAGPALDGDGPAEHNHSSDALARLPKTYGDVPRLGPPLPGDLGQPILEQQQEQNRAPAGVDRARGVGEGAGAIGEAGQQRARARERAARSSFVLVRLEGAEAGPQQAAPADARGDAAEMPATQAAAAPPARPSRILAPVVGRRGAIAARGAPPRSTLTAGTVIPATLITGLDSDVPGPVLAQVSENVRDAATGRTILVPQGARLIGSYASAVAHGQRRAMLVWKRIVFPDGSSVELGDVTATDASGYAGVADRVDFHTWGTVKALALSTLAGIGSELSLGGGGAIARAIRQSAQQNGASAGDQIASRGLEVRPTITVRPGWPVRAIVTRDVALQPWRG